ncbi:MAG: DUF6916 family protein [Isosphaeraceae bacterium]
MPELPSVPAERAKTALSPLVRPLDRTSAEIFERHLGTDFLIVAGAGTAPQCVHLAKVTRSETIAGPGRRAPESTPAFSLIFLGSPGTALIQDTYRVEHPQIGVFPLFLVQIGPDPAEVRYEAIFA